MVDKVHRGSDVLTKANFGMAFEDRAHLTFVGCDGENNGRLAEVFSVFLAYF